jgi:hypothetical protein
LIGSVSHDVNKLLKALAKIGSTGLLHIMSRQIRPGSAFDAP